MDIEVESKYIVDFKIRNADQPRSEEYCQTHNIEPRKVEFLGIRFVIVMERDVDDRGGEYMWSAHLDPDAGPQFVSWPLKLVRPNQG